MTIGRHINVHVWSEGQSILKINPPVFVLSNLTGHMVFIRGGGRGGEGGVHVTPFLFIRTNRLFYPNDISLHLHVLNVLLNFFTSVSSLQEESDIRRIKWTQKWLPRYFHQHIYVPLLYCVVSKCTLKRKNIISSLDCTFIQLTIKTRLQDFPLLLARRNGALQLCSIPLCYLHPFR